MQLMNSKQYRNRQNTTIISIKAMHNNKFIDFQVMCTFVNHEVNHLPYCKQTVGIEAMHGYSSIATCTMHMLNGTVNKQSMLQMSKVIHNGITILLKMKIQILLSK